jgi:hypothetical protein
MKSIVLPLLAVFTILINVFFPFMDAAAEDKTCIFKADTKKVHIIVWDEDSGQDRQGKTFEGWLKSGERKTVQSSTGFIVFSYQLADDDRSYGDNHRTCKSGNIIKVP